MSRVDTVTCGPCMGESSSCGSKTVTSMIWPPASKAAIAMVMRLSSDCSVTASIKSVCETIGSPHASGERINLYVLDRLTTHYVKTAGRKDWRRNRDIE